MIKVILSILQQMYGMIEIEISGEFPKIMDSNVVKADNNYNNYNNYKMKVL